MYNYYDKDQHMATNKYTELLEHSLLELDSEKALGILKDIVNTPDTPLTFVVDEVIAPTLDSIGKGWEDGDIALSQVYMAGRIMEKIIPQVISEDIKSVRQQDNVTIAIAVLEDFHALGKNIITSALKCTGYNVHNLGHGLSVEKIVDQVEELKPDILMISVLMFNKALHVKTLIELLREKGINVPVAVGGAPFNFNRELWQEVNANYCGHSISDVLDIINKVKVKLGAEG
jgi:methanogenic corrinoid protein MtbC1